MIASYLVDDMRNEGLVVISAGLHANVIRLLPPLVVEQDDLLDGVDRLERALVRTASA